MNFLTAPAGTAGSVGSTLAYFSNAMPLASARVGALAGVAATGAAGAAVRLTTVVVSPELRVASAKAVSRMRLSAPSAAPTILHSWRAFAFSASGATARPSASW